MQPIQDKDFDKLFKDAFADAEITPSKDLWSNIESEIEPKRTRKLPVYWFVAAAVLVIATVSVLVYQQQEVSYPQNVNNVIKTKPVVEENNRNDNSLNPQKPLNEYVTDNVDSKPVVAVVNKEKPKTKSAVKEIVVNIPVIHKEETMIAQVEVPKQELIKKKFEEAILQPKEEIMLAMVETPNDELESVGEQNKGIRNMGDVVNLIVNKVDKRKDKFIQFRTDDDDSSLSSINIGPFKFGKKIESRK